MPIRLTCDRCGTHLKVPETKAGKHGRCPTCGGRIHVPTLDQAVVTASDPSSRARGLAVGAVAVVLLALVVLLFTLLRQPQQTGLPPLPRPPEARHDTAPVQAREAPEDYIRRLNGLRLRLDEYGALSQRERVLMVRDIGARLKRYEPVSPEELSLRKALYGRSTEPGRGGLDEPLNEVERGELHRATEQLLADALDLAGDLSDAGIPARLERDALGRRLLDAEDARAELLSRLEALNKRRESS